MAVTVRGFSRIASATIVAGLLAAACGSSPAAPQTPLTPAPKVEAVIFSADFTPLRAPGDTAQITAVGVLTDLTFRDVTSTCTGWASDNTSVLTINAAGMVTARATSGSATVTTTCQAVSGRGFVTVNPPPSSVVPGSPTPPPTGGGSAPPAPTNCANPPYEKTTDADGTVHCREKSTGRFADNVCCGLPAPKTP